MTRINHRVNGLWAVMLLAGLGTACGADDSGDGDETSSGETGSSTTTSSSTTAGSTSTSTGPTTGETGSTTEDESSSTTGSIELGSLPVIVMQTGDLWWEDVGPAEGAMVAFDMPGGERVELTTGADGRLDFDDIDWSLGPATITAYLEGHKLSSHLGVTPEYVEGLAASHQGPEGELQLRLSPLEFETEFVPISGTASNMDDEQNILLVTPSISGGSNQSAGPTWSFLVAPNEPFTLVALEWRLAEEPVVSYRGVQQKFFKWASLDHKAVTESTSIELDMDNTLTPSTLSGSMPIPDHGRSNFFDVFWGYIVTGSWESARALKTGFPTLIDVTADGQSFEYDLEYVSPDFVEQPYWSFRARTGARWSTVRQPGDPIAGALDFVLPEPAEMPAGPTPSIKDELQWQLNAVDEADETLAVRLDVGPSPNLRRAGSWELWAAPGTTSARLPELPSAADPEAVFGGATPWLWIVTCDDSDPSHPGCERFTVSDNYLLSK